MLKLLRTVDGPWCWSWKSLEATLRGTHFRAGAQMLAGGREPLTGSIRAPSRRQQHTAAAEPVEVDVKRLEEEHDGIVEVQMCRHKARNALGHVFVSQMRELVSTLSSDSSVRVVVFKSLVPKVFCAGADLKERALMTDSESDLFVHGLRSLMTQIALLPMPTIAAIDGVAVGGGLELALACDLRTAVYSAQMGLIETTRGLLPGAGGSQRLPRMVGITLAKELIFTGRCVGGQAALEMGLVNRAVEQNQTGDAAYREALSLATEIVPQAPIAVRMAKEAMNRGSEVDISSAMAIERMCYARVIPTQDRREGMAAFIEKRPPRYTGQ
ncbi:enoyl-CoA hydratase domain-containing protein 2, mitochondrial [Solea senegalensis]|uniref:Enoyl-CoA hydratase domain-containing protein 2, mitochondrial n=2 Tax=Solea senegalensis TaxID=28829 RepID=A0AAV6S8X6_SOLSE|nr:enoyl-CoA hydratase domain-containing protein 2, mitochondrial isoform X1 [Solea senegalensis]KAG7514315.1 enoyl-CoA hydratase domain-containing protein 2, mitochondrial [Solea senegalensis]